MSDDVKTGGADYKSTLNLPQTDFPMQANLAKREPETLARWEAEGLYAQVQAETAGREAFWFVDGPPYANGDIHIGHAVNKVLKDIVVKAARLDGKHAPFTPGWDCHGLPIELMVEKKFGKVGEKLDAAAFRAECRKYAEEQIERQRTDFKRLGVLADWEQPYKTMQPAFEAEQLRVLARIVDNGHVVRGFKPVHWCLDCGSSLAEAEVEYQDKTSFAIDVRFAVTGAEVRSLFGLPEDGRPVGFVIWTTTPWTLPANRAIAVHPDIEYVLLDAGERGWLVVAKELAEACANRFGLDACRLASKQSSTAKRRAVEGDMANEWTAVVRGSAFEGLEAEHPFAGRRAKLIVGEHVTTEAGTGLVHTAPAHGLDDYLVGKRYGLAPESPLQSDGKFAAGTPVVGGMHVRKVDEPVLAALREASALIHEAKIVHSYPHCWRHKTPLIFRATPQWFVSMDSKSLRGQAVAAIDDTRWIPDWGRERIKGMVAERPDWCISRQRTWGVPLALFIDKRTQEKHPRSGELLRKVADAVAQGGLEAWFGSTVTDWLPPDEAADYERCTDTLDVWFDSGSVHQCSFVATNPAALDANGIAPRADFYLEGSDQHRGWFQSSLLTRVAVLGESPYRNVLTHGFTVDEQGRKMSKSLGNVVAPQKVTQTLGADVLRLWVASADYSGEIAISDNLLKRISDAYRRIRNTLRYLLGNLHGFDPATDAVAIEDMVAVDAWALSQAARVQEEIKKAYGESQFHLVYQALHNYCVVDLGGLYLDILKDRLYTLPPKSRARRSAQTAMWHIAEALTRWIAPILSFTADEVWPLLPGRREGSVFGQEWYCFPRKKIDVSREIDWASLVAVREEVNKRIEELRVSKKIGSSLEAQISFVAVRGGAFEGLKLLGEELRFWLITSSARISIIDPLAALTTAADDMIKVEIAGLDSPKCTRCWHRRPDIGTHAAHPELCGRCVENVEAIANGGDGERRLYV